MFCPFFLSLSLLQKKYLITHCLDRGVEQKLYDFLKKTILISISEAEAVSEEMKETTENQETSQAIRKRNLWIRINRPKHVF